MPHQEWSRSPLPLDWLDPTLDRCRLAIERGVDRSWQKSSSGTDPATVTNLDLEVEDILVAAIQDRFPEAKVVSEERHPEPSALGAPLCFVIDPIDGTEELLSGRSGFSISVALFEGSQPNAAVLDFPARAHRFQCGTGKGAWLEESPVFLRQSRVLDSARIAVSATQRRAPELESIWAGLKTAEFLPVPAFTPKFVSLLLGECDAAVHLPVDDRATFLWDYAAAAMLLSEAGGKFQTWAGETLLQELPAKFTGGWLAAATSELLAELRRVLQAALDEQASV
jgi:fructose-1,6-bisphosphatase/inositol monophosphatase family enzyme